MNFVLDCSVTMAWCFEDESTAYTENVLTSFNKDNVAYVPPIWALEVSNVLLVAERKKRISVPLGNNFKNALIILPIRIEHSSTDRIFDTIFELARELHLTAYDAAYLELALREKLSIATLDAKIIKAAQEINISRFLF